MSEDGRHPGISSTVTGVREPPVRGSVRILCDEIGFRFDPRLERPEVLAAFVRELVAEVADHRATAQAIAHLTGKPPSDGSAQALLLAEGMLSVPASAMIGGAVLLHEACHRLNPEDAYPTDHLIDMLSSCASAIRFGLEDRGLGFSSRHAADAAQHVWKQVYGVSRFDSETPAWENEWSRGKLLSAIISLIPPAAADTSEQSARPRDEPNPSPPEPAAELARRLRQYAGDWRDRAADCGLCLEVADFLEGLASPPEPSVGWGEEGSSRTNSGGTATPKADSGAGH